MAFGTGPTKKTEIIRCHEVQFYSHDAVFLESVTHFIGEALKNGNVAIVSSLSGTVEGRDPRCSASMISSDRISRRKVVTDPHARYFGAELNERSLVPDDGARLGETRFAEWLEQSTFRAHA